MTRNNHGLRATAYAGLVSLPLVALGCLSAAAQGAPPPGMEPAGPPDMAMRGAPDDRHGPDGMHGGGPLGELARAEADQVAVQAVAGLAKAPLTDVQRMVRAWGVPTALRYYDVPPKAFRDATLPGLVAVVRAAAQEQRISGADADRIVDRLQHEGPPPPPPPPLQ